MPNIELNLNANLIEGIENLAIRHYGSSQQSSIERVVEDSLELRLMWAELVTEGGKEVEEPVVNWELKSASENRQLRTTVRDLLFRRRENSA